MHREAHTAHPVPSTRNRDYQRTSAANGNAIRAANNGDILIKRICRHHHAALPAVLLKE